jgi:hypothetical protein
MCAKIGVLCILMVTGNWRYIITASVYKKIEINYVANFLACKHAK